MVMKNKGFQRFINWGLIISGLIMSFSGLLMQIYYHIIYGESGKAHQLVLSLKHSDWSLLHKISAIIFSLLIVYHIYAHKKWFTTVIKKKLIKKNKQLITLSVISILVMLTGYIPWIIMNISGATTLRTLFIEIHDKISILLFVFLILHVLKRIKHLLPKD